MEWGELPTPRHSSLPGASGNDGDTSDCHDRGMGVREDLLLAFRHPTIHRTACHNNYPAQSVPVPRSRSPVTRALVPGRESGAEPWLCPPGSVALG